MWLMTSLTPNREIFKFFILYSFPIHLDFSILNFNLDMRLDKKILVIRRYNKFEDVSRLQFPRSES